MFMSVCGGVVRGQLQVLNLASTLFEVGSPAENTNLAVQWNLEDFLVFTSYLPVGVLWLQTGYHAWFLYGFQEFKFRPAYMAGAPPTGPSRQPKGMQFVKPRSSVLWPSTFSSWAAKGAYDISLWSSAQMFPSSTALTTSARPWVLLVLLLGG